MKIYLTAIICSFAFFSARSQQDSVYLELLNAPANAAFNLMGLSPDAIERPTDLNAFRISVQNATNNFTKFPSNYALEISPAALLGIKNQTLEKFNSKDFKNVFWQSLAFSTALSKADAEGNESNSPVSSTKIGIGLKFSVIRPHWDDKTAKNVDTLYMLEEALLDESKKRAATIFLDSALRQALVDAQNLPSDTTGFKAKTIMEQLQRLTDFRKTAASNANAAIDSEINKRLRDAQKNLQQFAASGLKFTRKGVFLDFATGIVLDFPDDRFDNSSVGKAGAWLTGGYQGGNKWEVLAIGRYLFQPDKIFADTTGNLLTSNISTLDFGAKMVGKGMDGKLVVSAEGLYRSVLNKDVIDPTWRLVFNASYDIGKSQALTFSVGKNFDGTVTKGGNLIAALNFIAGFGGNKKYLGNPQAKL